MDRIQAIKAKLKESLYIEQKDEKEDEYEDESEDESEDQEGATAKAQLKNIIANAQKLHDSLKDEDELPAWAQNKLTLAQHNVEAASEYMSGDVNEEVDVSESRSDDPDYDEALKRQKKGLPPIKRKSPYKKDSYWAKRKKMKEEIEQNIVHKFRSYMAERIESEYLEINESADDSSREGGVSNNTKGVLHELLVGKHLNGGKHLEKHENERGESPQEAHDRLKSQIHPKDYEKIRRNSESAANHIKEHLAKNHPGQKIHQIHWTSKPGDTEKVTGHKATQKQDSSDIYVTTKNSKGKLQHHGFSLKVSDKTNKNIPSSSLGSRSSGSAAADHLREHRKDILAAHPKLVGIKDAARRKEILKNNPAMKEDIKKRNLALLRKVAHSHAAELQHHLDSGNHEHVINHIREVLHAHKTPAEADGKAGHTFTKHTTYQTAKGVQHHISKPSEEYEHILKDHKNIKVVASGTQVHFYHNGKKFASQSHKFDSQSDPLSPLKSAGRAT